MKPLPLIEPDVRISRIRLTDTRHTQDYREEVTAWPHRYRSP
jgi:hypothetical protein